MSRQRSPQDRNRSRPRVEQLEDRWTPAVTTTPDTVFINGTDGPDQIVVYDNGALYIHENGRMSRVISDYKRNVKIQTFDGSDTVIYRQISRARLPGPFRDRNIEIELGNHNDVASVSFVSNFESNYNATLRGGRGDDMLLASAAGRMRADSLPAAINIFMFGDAGNDSLDVRSSNDIRRNTGMIVRQNGGTGLDTLIHEYEGSLEGSLLVFQDGGDGEQVYDFRIPPL